MTNDNTAPVLKTPIHVDYTNRDYYSLREELISRVQHRIPEWVGSDSADFGVALLEAFAYMGDVTSYYIDRIANEQFLATASQRSSVLEIAKGYGYNPAGYGSATCTLSFGNKTSLPITLPAGTEVYGTIVESDLVRQIIFTTKSDVTIPGNGVQTVSAIHGYYTADRNPATDSLDVGGEAVGASNGLPNQLFQLSQNQVVDGTPRVFVKNGSSYGEWSYVRHLTDYGPNDAVFSTESDENNYVSIVFGDGVSGAIPPLYASIKVNYLVGGGTTGNVDQNKLINLYSIPSKSTSEVASLSQDITVTNSTAATGGTEPDSLETIKRLAPEAFSSLNRAVTLEDYASLALQISNVDKAKAVSSVGSSVTLYVSPKRDSTAADPYPLYNETNSATTTEWDAGDGTGLKYTVANELTSKTQVGVSVTVSPPTYVPVIMVIRYNLLPQYTNDQVIAQIKDLLATYYDYSSVYFGQTIYPEDIEFILKYAAGASNVNVISMYRYGDAVSRNVLIGGDHELFVFDRTNTAITQASTVSTLSDLDTGSGTLTPTFANEFYNYSLVIGTGVTSVTITPARTDAGSTIYVNGTLTASGSAATITTAVGVTTVSIRVVAQDIITSKTYTVTITRPSS